MQLNTRKILVGNPVRLEQIDELVAGFVAEFVFPQWL
jgi:hypothetical protein